LTAKRNGAGSAFQLLAIKKPLIAKKIDRPKPPSV
jgi:hypothetical protein